MIDKEFIQANDLVRDSFALAKQVYDSGFCPDVLLVLWRGGTPIGVVVHEFLLYKGIETYHTAVKAESYTGIARRIEPRIEHLDGVLGDIADGSRVLVVDDIFDSGCTVRKVCEMLRARTRHIKIATLYYKPGKNKTDIVPDFYLRETDRWIVFPHELMGLSLDEIRAKDNFVHALLDDS